jgi:hypothetical protein
MPRHEAYLSSGESDSPQPGDPSSKAACPPTAKSSVTAGIPAESIALVRHCSPEARLGDLARLLARQAARELQLPLQLQLGEGRGQADHQPEPDRLSSGVRRGIEIPTTPESADGHGQGSGSSNRRRHGRS